MTSLTRRGAVRTLAATVAVSALALPLTACSSSADDGGAAAGDGAGTITAESVSLALEEGGDLLIWGWDPTFQGVVDAFEAQHPNVNVTLANVGMTEDHYTALQNAITAGTGIPDLAQFEYQALGQFVIMDALADLTPFGAGDLDGTFTPGTWGAVTTDDGVFGLPLDSGPMALFYNADVFAEHGLEVPATWDEYIEAARALRAADPSIAFGADGIDAGLATSIIWQAGGQPFEVDGTTVSVDLVGDPGAARYAEIFQQLHDEDLIANITGWSDEWFQALGNGSLATLLTGAWIPTSFETGAAAGHGSWRVAPMPQFAAGETATAELGGSALSMMSGASNKALAYAFLEFAAVGDGVGIRLDDGAFPATVADLEDEEFLSREFDYFGGQQVNRVLAESAATVVEGWQYLPFQAYANSIFPETVGQAFLGNGTILDGLQAWQDRLIAFGQTQGFTMQ